MSKRYQIVDTESESDDVEDESMHESDEESELESEESASEISDASDGESDYSDNKRPGERNGELPAIKSVADISDSVSVASMESTSNQDIPNDTTHSPVAEYDNDSDSLRSIETVNDAAKQNSIERGLYPNANNDLDSSSSSSSFVPKGGIFEHALLKGVPVTIADDYGEDKDASLGTSARTTTRNTPTTVMDAIDRELRFAKPPVTVEHLVNKYNVIKLVIKRRIDHLKSLGQSTPGITIYDMTDYERNDGVEEQEPEPRHQEGEDSAETSVYGDGTAQQVQQQKQQGSAAVDALNDPEMRRRLYFDIQFLSPPITVRELAYKYNIHLPTLQTKLSFLRNKGISMGGIISNSSGTYTAGRGRPRKIDQEEYHSSARSPVPREQQHASKERTVGYKRPPLHFFSAEEDATIITTVHQCNTENVAVRWFALDDSFGRHRGASKQRWLKTLSLKQTTDAVLPPQPGDCTDDHAYLWSTYKELSVASARRHTVGSLPSSTVATVATGNSNEISNEVRSSAAIPEAESEASEDASTGKQTEAKIEGEGKTEEAAKVEVKIEMDAAELRREVQNSVRCMIVSLEKLAHNKAQQDALRRAAAQQRASYGSKSGSAAGAPVNVEIRGGDGGRRKSTFTAADDAFIIKSVLESQAQGYKVVWSHLDKEMGRFTGSARARWLRTLQQQAATMQAQDVPTGDRSGGGGSSSSDSNGNLAGLNNGASSKERLWSKYSAFVASRKLIYAHSNGTSNATSAGEATSTGQEELEECEERLVSRAVLRAMISVVVEDHNESLSRGRSAVVRTFPPNLTTTHSRAAMPIKSASTPSQHVTRPFSAQEDAYISHKALKWISRRSAFHWQKLDTRLSRSADDSCYNRWLNVLCDKLPPSAPVSAQRAQLVTVYASTCDALVSAAAPAVPASQFSGESTEEEARYAKLVGSAVMNSMLRAVLVVHSIRHDNISSSNAHQQHQLQYQFQQPQCKQEPHYYQNQSFATAATTATATFATSKVSKASSGVNSGVGRVLKRFTAAEDALITARVLEYHRADQGVKWGSIDKELGRSPGAAKQRWMRVLAVTQPQLEEINGQA